MMDLSDSRWADLQGGYRCPFDASEPLRKLEESDQPPPEVWEQLWENLYHQGDVGLASYSAVPHLIRIYEDKGWLDGNICFFFAKVEEARRQNHNPPVPDGDTDEYQESLLRLVRHAARRLGEQWEYSVLQGLLLLIAIIQDFPNVAQLIDFLDEGVTEKILDKMF